MKLYVHTYQYNIFSTYFINYTFDKRAINCSISSKDLIKQLTRVKSSNLWGLAIDSTSKSKTGNMIIQFKGKNGGPGDIYMYFDVPFLVYRRFQSAPSKGHYFWQYIRNNYKYRKLTGNKRGVLPNAVN